MCHVNPIRSKTERKTMWLPVTSSGGSLEPAGNGRTQTDDRTRHNPAYRSADFFVPARRSLQRKRPPGERDGSGRPGKGVYTMWNITLASASPRRKELLIQAGFSPEIVPSSVEEKITGRAPSETAEELSRIKCLDVAQKKRSAGNNQRKTKEVHQHGNNLFPYHCRQEVPEKRRSHYDPCCRGSRIWRHGLHHGRSSFSQG